MRLFNAAWKKNDVYEVIETWTNRSPDESWIKPVPDQDCDIVILFFLIDYFLLNKEAILEPPTNVAQLPPPDERERLLLEETSLEIFGTPDRVREVQWLMLQHAIIGC